MTFTLGGLLLLLAFVTLLVAVLTAALSLSSCLCRGRAALTRRRGPRRRSETSCHPRNPSWVSVERKRRGRGCCQDLRAFAHHTRHAQPRD